MSSVLPTYYVIPFLSIRYQAVGILRALSLKEKSPQDFSTLLKLQSNARAKALRLEQGNEEVPPHYEIGMTKSVIRDFFQQAQNNVSEELVENLQSIIETNGHEIPLPGSYGQQTRRLIGK